MERPPTSTLTTSFPSFSFSFDNPAFRANPTDEPTTLQAHHRRVELQSPQDLLYLRDNVRRAAIARIDAVVNSRQGEGNGGQQGGKDGGDEREGEDREALRAQISAQIDGWITSLFHSTLTNISINGLDGEDPSFSSLLSDTTTATTISSTSKDKNGTGDDDTARARPEEYENYDSKLASKISSMYTTIERLNLELADTRRSVVARDVANFKQEWERQGRELERAFEEARREEGEVAQARDEEDRTVVEGVREGLWFGGGERQGRHEEVRETWSSAVEGLGKVQRELEETRERAQRARGVVGVLEVGGGAGAT